MVHLAKVKTDQSIADSKLPELEGLNFGPSPGQDEFTASVYGSRFAAQDLPKHEMPDNEMPREVAYRMIKDDLTLDGTPTLK
jgi:glutamate decarboxylase